MTPTEPSTRASSQLSTTSTLRAVAPRVPGSNGERGRDDSVPGSNGGRGRDGSRSRGGHGSSRGREDSGGNRVLLKSVYVEGAGWASQVYSCTYMYVRTYVYWALSLTCNTL